MKCIKRGGVVKGLYNRNIGGVQIGVQLSIPECRYEYRTSYHFQSSILRILFSSIYEIKW